MTRAEYRTVCPECNEDIDPGEAIEGMPSSWDPGETVWVHAEGCGSGLW